MPNLILNARSLNDGMGKLIAEKTVKLMVKEDKKIKGANILILGVTFKENCPDMRNTKVVDIINELQEYGCNVDVYDYWVDETDKKTKRHIPFIDELPLNFKKYEAIVVAVAHDKFKEITKEEYENMSNGKPIVIDVKGIVEDPTWRL